MADRERTIRGLECCAVLRKCVDNKCPYYDDYTCTTSLAHDALALLKETESVKPRTEDAWPTPIKICGSCGACLFCVGDYKPKFCAECGRAVKWDA